jgi:Zn-dependent alcohol dehydrogenase
MSSIAQFQTQAIVCRPPQDGERKWVLEKVSLSSPADDEVIVEIVATGICHTDFVCGSVPDEALPLGLPPYPRVLGHEGHNPLTILIRESRARSLG